MTSDEIWEECICDSLGDMNIFANKSKDVAAAMDYTIKEIKKAVAEQKAEPNQTRGSPEAAQNEGKASRETSKKGKSKVPPVDEFATNAMIWAFSAKTNPGDIKVIFNPKNNTWNKLIAENTERRYAILLSVEDTPQNAKAIRNLYNEVYNDNNNSKQRTLEGVRDDYERYWDLSRNSRDDNINVEEQISNGRNSEIFRKESQSNGERNSQQGTGDSELKGKASRELDAEYLSAVERGDMVTAQRMVDEAAKKTGYIIKAYHGTARGDRVGNVFLPERATSGPMAFFTDNKNIADHYARDKSDTSLAYDTEYDSYYTQFRVNHNGKSISIPELWYQLSFSEKSKIMQRVQHITFDENSENIVYDSNAKYGLGGLDSYRINSNKGNYLRALIEEWLEDGNLYNEEQRFLDVLKLVGIENVEYRDPQMRYAKTYDTWLRIYSPFDTDNVNQSFYDGLSEWIKDNDMSVYERESSNADLWDKNNQTPESWLDKLSYDMENNTTHAWTVIPDFVTDYIKTQGYDGIKDKGGKNGGAGHTVWIPFSSEQIKSADPVTYDDNGNVIPLSERFNAESNDIRYSREIDALDYITPEEDFEGVDEMAFSNRELLANALLDTVTSSEEYKLIRSYQEEIAQLERSDKIT